MANKTLDQKKGTIAHYLNQPDIKNEIDSLAFNPSECKKKLIEYLRKGVETGEITDKDEVEKIIPIIEKVKANQFYSIYATLLTGMKMGIDGMGGNTGRRF